MLETLIVWLRKAIYLRLRLMFGYNGCAMVNKQKSLNSAKYSLGNPEWANDWHRSRIEQCENVVSELCARLDDLAVPRTYLRKSKFDVVALDIQRDFKKHFINVPKKLKSEFANYINNCRRINEFLSNSESYRKTVNELFMRKYLQDSSLVFESIGGKWLTEEQRSAIIVDEDHNLVIASAGSGKTSVIIGKLMWLINQGNLDANEILMLVFANNAKLEITERIGKLKKVKLNSGPLVNTFHSLGNNIIGEVEGKKPSLSPFAGDDKKLRLCIREIIANLMNQKAFSLVMYNWFQEYFTPYRSEYEFDSMGDYWEYLRKHDIRSFNGDKVRSYQECKIANFLYLYGVPYEYERKYVHETATKSHRPYYPDFYLTEANLYIEHLALNRKGQTPPYINCDKYINDLNWKRKLHKEHGTKLLETYSWWQSDGTLIQRLKEMLKKEGVELAPIPPKVIFDQLIKLHQFDSFTTSIIEFLKHFKEQGLKVSDLPERLGIGYERERNKAFIEVFLPIYDAYEKYLNLRGDIDYSDMMKKATEYVETGMYRSPFRYILVDEFQDISQGAKRLLCALLDRGRTQRVVNCQLYAVGDDWQSIYRFAGADISVMQNFESTFGCVEQKYLTTSFRCSRRVVEVSRKFVLKNQDQIDKVTKSHNSDIENGVHIYYYSSENKLSTLTCILDSINKAEAKNDGKVSVFLLGRYNKIISDDIRTTHKMFGHLTLEYKTIHSSKGCQADYVIVLGMDSGEWGFPSNKQRCSSVEMILPQSEKFPHAEERRILYVAMTRARKSVYLLSEYAARSEFIEELVNENNDVEIHGVQPHDEPICPVCKTGRIVYRQSTKGERGYFWGCNNYPYCEHKPKKCAKCNVGIPIKKQSGHECNSCSKKFESCPVDGCEGWLVDRISEHGPFVGCSAYPECSFKYDKNRKN